MSDTYFGNFINLGGHGNYKTPDSVENVIRYITRTNARPKPGLICWDGIGILKDTGVASVIRQFELAQEMNKRTNPNARYIDHEIFSFSKKGTELLAKGNIDLDSLAWELSADFYHIDKCQVIYAIHAPDENVDNLHIHFAINTFDCCTGKKRRENISQNNEREARFQQIIARIIRESIQK